MNETTLTDFLEADITIHTVKNVDHWEHPGWKRTPAFPRRENGLNFLISGPIEYNYGGEIFRGLPGQVIKLPAGVPYSGVKLDNTMTEYVRVDFYSDPAEYERFPLPHSFTPSAPDSVLNAFLELEKLFHSHAIGSRLECKNALYALLLTLVRDAAIHQYHYDDHNDTVKISQYILRHLQNPSLRVENIADSLHISGTHLRRIFESQFGTTPSAYIARLRMEKACSLLRSSSRIGIESIAERCGYSSVYYFSAAFRRAMGRSPTEYRKHILSERAETE